MIGGRYLFLCSKLLVDVPRTKDDVHRVLDNGTVEISEYLTNKYSPQHIVITPMAVAVGDRDQKFLVSVEQFQND